MSESASIEDLSNVDEISTNEQPRKYLRRNNVGVQFFFLYFL